MPTQNQKRQRQKMGRQARQAALVAARKRRARRNRAIVAGFLAVLLVLGVATFVGGGGDDETEVATDTTAPASEVSLPPVPAGATVEGDTPCPQPDGSSPRTTRFAKPPPMCIDPNRRYVAEIKTNLGLITATLDAKAAPKTVNNFVVLARYHFFDGISFHRIIPGFVIQGGDPELNGQGGPGYKFEDELPQPGQYKIGSLAMAKEPEPNTNGSQFFIITGEQGVALPPQYSLFGEVTGGLDVVQKIDAAGSPNSREGRPTQVVTMESVIIKEA